MSTTTSSLLLDDDGEITLHFEKCLRHIFAKYCTPPAQKIKGVALLEEGASLTPAGLEAWAKDTNGEAFAEGTVDELKEFMDVTDEGNLTFKGFLQVYQLQTENDEEETWKDLRTHGFDRNLQLV